MITYEGSGSVKITGCALPTSVEKIYLHKFGIGSVAYVKVKAQKGKLLAISIKKVNRIMPESPTCMGIQPIINYVDHTNRVWLEDELVWHSEAVPLAILYWETIAADAEALLDASGCHDATAADKTGCL